MSTGTYLAYDAELLGALRQAMVRAGDELAAIRCTDVEASTAMVRVAVARSTIGEAWIPFIDGLLQCRALDGYVPAVIDPGDLVNAWIAAMATARGWQVSTDAFGSGDVAAMTVDAAGSLGAALSGGAGTEDLSAEELAWLAARLQEIAGSPDLVAAFLPALTTVGWANLVNQLAEIRQHAFTEALLYDGTVSPAESAEWAPIDSSFAALGTMLAVDAEAHPLSDPLLLLGDMAPLAAALLVQHLRLDAVALADVARQLIERERIDLYSSTETNLGPRAADVLFGALLTTPAAATLYVSSTLDDPGLLLDVAFDPRIASAVLIAGTDPDAMSPAIAAQALPVLIRWILTASMSSFFTSTNPDIAITAADLVAPYVLPVLLPDGRGFAMTAAERRALQLLIIDDTRAMAHLLAARERIAAELGVIICDPDATANELADALDDLAGVLAIVDTMVRAGTIRSAERAIADWEMTWTMIGSIVDTATARATPKWGLLGPATAAFKFGAEAAGWGPKELSDVRADSLRDFDVATTVAAAGVVCAAFDALLRAGRIAPGTPLPPVPDLDADHVGTHYTAAFDEWTEDLDPALVHQFRAIKNTIASSHEAASNANEELHER